MTQNATPAPAADPEAQLARWYGAALAEPAGTWSGHPMPAYFMPLDETDPELVEDPGWTPEYEGDEPDCSQDLGPHTSFDIAQRLRTDPTLRAAIIRCIRGDQGSFMPDKAAAELMSVATEHNPKMTSRTGYMLMEHTSEAHIAQWLRDNPLST